MRASELPASITASKADWLAGTTWLGFSPTHGSLQSRNQCQSTIQRQYAGDYVIEYIAEQFSKPNPGFEANPEYLAERDAHEDLAGRFIAVHKLRTTARDLETIIGLNSFPGFKTCGHKAIELGLSIHHNLLRASPDSNLQLRSHEDAN